LTGYALANVGAFWHYWTELNIAEKPGMNAAAHYLSEHMDGTDALISGTSFEFFNLKYYLSQVSPPRIAAKQPQSMTSGSFALEDLSDDASSQAQAQSSEAPQWPKPLLYTNGTTKAHEISHFAGSAILTDEDLLPRLESAGKAGSNAWIVWTNAFGSSKPKVPDTWQQVDEAGFADARPYVGTWIVVTKYLVR
jgi:hypothetical protein